LSPCKGEGPAWGKGVKKQTPSTIEQLPLTGEEFLWELSPLKS